MESNLVAQRRCCKLRGCCICNRRRRQARSQTKISFFNLTASVTCNQARPARCAERQSAWKQPCSAWLTSSVTCIRSEPLSLLLKARFLPATLMFGEINPTVSFSLLLTYLSDAHRQISHAEKETSRHLRVKTVISLAPTQAVRDMSWGCFRSRVTCHIQLSVPSTASSKRFATTQQGPRTR